MRFLDLTLPTLAENLALDEALLLEAEAGQGEETLRVWEWPTPAVVLGAGSRLAEDVDEAACRADNVPILRRSSGGGTVLLGKGCLLYSLVLSYERSAALRFVRPSYEYILGRIRDGLRSLVPGIELAGISDLAVAGRKVSGNAQQRKRLFLLHHGTLLYDFDMEWLEGYLRMPARQPAYRQGRPHTDFLANLPLTQVAIKEALALELETTFDSGLFLHNLTQGLALEKYSRLDWIRRC